jgi:hypothetical protein
MLVIRSQMKKDQLKIKTVSIKQKKLADIIPVSAYKIQAR